MKINFSKYQGAGNDFIIVDDQKGMFNKIGSNIIRQLCDRHLGIGADGLMLLKKSANTDFKMIYYNSDGLEGTMCGNGGRCITHFAYNHGLCGTQITFSAIDGLHKAEILDDNLVRLKMMDTISNFHDYPDGVFVDTGSPHFVMNVENIESIDVFNEGRKIRLQDRFNPGGVNVNFIQPDNGLIHIATYERGVENETLACGTGSVAAALVYARNSGSKKQEIELQAKGGRLKVSFLKKNNNTFTNVWLEGGAVEVFREQ